MLGLVTFLIAWMVHLEIQAQTAAELNTKLKTEQAALDSLEARLAHEEARLKQTQRKVKSEAEALIALERNIFQTKKELRVIQHQERDLEQRLNNTEKQLYTAEEHAKIWEKEMAQRFRNMYKLGRRSTLSLMFSSSSFSDALRRARYLARVADQDQRDFRTLQTERKQVTDLYLVQNAQHQQQQALLQGKLKKEQSLNRLASDKTQTLHELKKNVSARKRAVEEMEAQKTEYARRIAETIKQIQTKQLNKQLAKLPPFDFESIKGNVRRPVSGSVVTRFGRQQDPELKTWTFNRGINIAAPEGTQVETIAPGEVVMVDWFPGYGRFVLLRHPDDYYSLYGHLSSDLVQVGKILPEGSVVGNVGSTGRLDGVSQLHFEIMKGEEPLDPLVWLRK